MKRIIFDHFRRWWLVLIIILIAYFTFQAATISENNSQMSGDSGVASVHHTINTIHNTFIFQAVMWLGFLLIWDFQRGLPRVLTSMPVTTKQIGRAWWLAAVAIPAIALGVMGLLALLFFSGGKNIANLLENYSTGWVLASLYLGAAFGALTFATTTIPDDFADKIRVFLANLLFALVIIGFLFLQMETISRTQQILISAACAVLSTLGWFRAEQMVLQRAGFRLVAQSSGKKMSPHKIPQGFGGLPYLMRRIFIQSTLIGLVLITWVTLFTSFFYAGPKSAQAFASQIESGSTPWIFFIVFFSVIPLVFQLRFLRTLPVSSSALAAMLVFLPIISIAVVGVIITTVASLVLGEAVILPAANSFLMLGVKAAIIVPLAVWRGLDAVTFFLMFLLMISGSFVTLMLTLIFHLTKTPENPWWASLIIFTLCVAASFALTQRLLVRSSSAYRVRTMPGNA